MITAYRDLIDRQLPRIERSCTSKVAYAARREAASYARHGRHQDGSLRPYHCTYCDGWHLGHRRSLPH